MAGTDDLRAHIAAEVPPLDSPVLMAAFEGWNDAAEASTGVIDHLLETLSVVTVCDLDPDPYYDFQVNRPSVELIEGTSRAVEWPTSSIYVAKPTRGAHDLVLVRGLEPNMRWRAFCEEILGVGALLGIESTIVLGAFLADSPHSRPVPITGSASQPELAARLGLSASNYEGPTGITGVFHDLAGRSGMPSVSFWAAVPHYVAQPPCPPATLALLHRVEDYLDATLPLGDLEDQARAWERGVDELSRRDAEIGEYVRQLEEREAETELPEASGDAIARDFERYLRRREEDDGKR